nr:hypothetical protein [Eubacterium sp.]
MNDIEFRKGTRYPIVATLVANFGFWFLITILEIADSGEATLIFGISALIFHVGTYFWCERRYLGEKKKVYHFIFYPVGLITTIPMGMLAIFIQNAVAPKYGFLEGIQYFFYAFALFAIYAIILFLRVMIMLWTQSVSAAERSVKTTCVILFLCGIAWASTIIVNNVVHNTRENSVAHYEYRYEEEKEDDVADDPLEEQTQVKPKKTTIRKKEKVDSEGVFNKAESALLIEMEKQFECDLELTSSAEVEWPGITWETRDGEYHVVGVDFSYHEGVKGEMDFSDFKYLQHINLSGTSVTEVKIPKTTTKIELKECGKLKKIVFGKNYKELNYLSLPDDYRGVEYSLKQIVFLGDAPFVELEDGSEFFDYDTPIYRKKDSKGWDDERWEDRNLKFLG